MARSQLIFNQLHWLPPSADWGMMIASGRQYVLGGSWWVAGVPSLAIMRTALAFAVLGDGLRDAGNKGR